MLEGVPRNRVWVILALLLLCHLYFFQLYPRFLSPNEVSRLLLTSAIVDDGTFQIDRSIRRYGDTQDKATFGGHFYSDKAIGTSLLGLPAYGIFAVVRSLFRLQWPAAFVIFWLRVVTIVLPSLFLFCLLTRFWKHMNPPGDRIPHILMAFAFGTTAFTYSVQFVSHHLVGVFLFSSFYCLYQFKLSGSIKMLLLSGLLTGASLTIEYPAALPAAALFGYLIWILPDRKKAGLWVMCIIPSVLLMLGYNYAVFGTPFDVTYRHMVDPYFIENYEKGFVGLSLPKAEAFYELLISPAHGVFFWSPFLLFSIPGYYLLLRDRAWYREGWLLLAVSLLYILFTGSQNDWIGGAALGSRYLAGINPFLISACYFFFTRENIRHKSWITLIGIVTACLSILMISIATITFPYPPGELEHPLIHLYLPVFFNGAFGLNAGQWLSLPSIGTAVVFLVLVLITFLFMVMPDSGIRFPEGRRLGWSTVAAALILSCLGVMFVAAGPTGAPDHFARAKVYFFLDRIDLARAEMMEALDRNPDEATRALILRSLERLKEQK